METQTLTVTGMTCEHCVRSVQEEVGAIQGVQRVEVDLSTGAVAVHSDRPVEDAEIEAAVREAGYEVSG